VVTQRQANLHKAPPKPHQHPKAITSTFAPHKLQKKNKETSPATTDSAMDKKLKKVFTSIKTRAEGGMSQTFPRNPETVLTG
jgi:hypothetical protein